MQKPWLFLSAQLAHDMAPYLLNLWGSTRDFVTYSWKPLLWRGLEFSNPLGIAGGVDKNAKTVMAWWTFGVGFLEIGTVTPKPQGPNPGKIMDRDIARQAVWNRLGFPNDGVQRITKRLELLPKPTPTPIFANIGKNRTTSNKDAVQDYLTCMNHLFPHVDGFVVNISSPNTPDLRELFAADRLKNFLQPLVLRCAELSEQNGIRPLPILLKMSPDNSDSDLLEQIDLSREAGIDGWILTNTTTSRNNETKFPKEGGISGQPLKARAQHCLELVHKHLAEQRSKYLLISAGGILSPQDAFHRLDSGADLLQVYSSLILQGPLFFKHVYKEAIQHYNL